MTSFAGKNVELLAWATYGIIKYLEIKFLHISCQLSCCVDENRGQDENKGRVNNSSSARHPWFFSFHILTLRKKCPYLEFFWPVFSHIRTEYGYLLWKCPYPTEMQENTDQKNSDYGHVLPSVSSETIPNGSVKIRLFLKIWVLNKKKYLCLNGRD